MTRNDHETHNERAAISLSEGAVLSGVAPGLSPWRMCVAPMLDRMHQACLC